MGLLLSPQVSPVRAKGRFRFCSAANVAWYGMHFDSYPWRLQGLLRIPKSRLGLRSVLHPDVPIRTLEYLTVMGRGAAGAHLRPPTDLPRKLRRQERMESSSSWQI